MGLRPLEIYLLLQIHFRRQNLTPPSESVLSPFFFCLQVKVSVCVVFLKVGEIDTLKEHYEADVMIKSKWREPLLDKGRAEVRIERTI